MSEPTPTSPAPSVQPAAASRRCPVPVGLRLSLALLLLLLVALGGWNAWRLAALQSELASRVHGVDASTAQATALAHQAIDAQRDLGARLAVVEAREQDLGAQRQALQQLVQDLARSRDEALLTQIGAGLEAAQQQADLSGSPIPLLGALTVAATRLKHSPGPRAALLLRAVLADQQHLRANTAVIDVPTAAARLDQLGALVDQLRTPASAQREPARSAAARSALPPSNGWRATVQRWSAAAWQQLSQLVSVTRIDRPDTMLASPQQDQFLRQNLKLHVLSAHLDLLARNADAYSAELHAIELVLRSQFDPQQSQLQLALNLLQQARQIDLRDHPESRLQSLSVLSSLGLGAP